MQTRHTIALSIALAGIASVGLDAARADTTVLNAQTRADLKAVMQNEAFTALKYRLFAEQARRSGKIALAELFEQTASAEHRHFQTAAEMYGLAREDWHNVANAIVGEYEEVNQVYARAAERAEAVGDKEVARKFREIVAEEVAHDQSFKAAVAKAFKRD